MSFKQFVEEIAANAMGDGSAIATIYPVMTKKPLKRRLKKKLGVN